MTKLLVKILHIFYQYYDTISLLFFGLTFFSNENMT